MSISRAYKELKTLNILDDIRIIRIKETLTSQRVEQVWNKVKNYLFNPIQSVVYIEKDSLEYDLRKKLTYSGETALSDYTMLIQPREETFAIYKREWDILKESAILVPYKTDYCYIIELWKHKVPLLYNKIHPLALYLSMKDSSDERIRGELEILLENYFRS